MGGPRNCSAVSDPPEISLHLVWVLGSGMHEANMMYGAFGAQWSPFRAKDESLKVP